MKAAVIMDMFGCPNRCRHCWLGDQKNGYIPGDEFIRIAGEFPHFQKDGTEFFNELLFSTWYREPDYSSDYKDLFALEKQLSAADHYHFELASIWRLVRDADYAPWLKSVGVDTVQLTLFGTEKNTDYYSGRKGAFIDIFQAIDVLLRNGISPRIQVFPFSDTIDDINDLWRLLNDIEIEAKVKAISRDFACFFNTLTPTGRGFNLVDKALRRDDIEKLPSGLLEKTFEHFKIPGIEGWLKAESELLPELLEEEKPLDDEPEDGISAFMIDGNYDVYPNCGEMAEWWQLGNIKKDGIDAVIDTFINHGNPGLKMNFELPVRYFAEKYGNPQGDRLWVKSDLVLKWIHQQGEELRGGNLLPGKQDH